MSATKESTLYSNNVNQLHTDRNYFALIFWNAECPGDTSYYTNLERMAEIPVGKLDYEVIRMRVLECLEPTPSAQPWKAQSVLERAAAGHQSRLVDTRGRFWYHNLAQVQPLVHYVHDWFDSVSPQELADEESWLSLSRFPPGLELGQARTEFMKAERKAAKEFGQDSALSRHFKQLAKEIYQVRKLHYERITT